MSRGEMKKLRFGSVGVLVLAAASACGGEDSGEGGGLETEVFFSIDAADAAAHEALPVPADLGTGWEVVSRDEFDEDTDGEDFAALMEGEPACSTMSALAGLGGLFGSSDDEIPAGRANVEMVWSSPDAQLPSNAEFEVEIEETVAEVQGSWTLVKELIGSEDFEGCMLAVFPKALAEEDLPEGATVDVSTRAPSAQAPNNGATIAYDIGMDLGALQFDMAMEMYMWPVGNAAVTAMFVGGQDSVDAELTEPTLAAFEQRLRDAAS